MSAAARTKDSWQLNGHGLTCPNLNNAKALGDVTVVNAGEDKAFQKLAHYTFSATLPENVTFEQLCLLCQRGSRCPFAVRGEPGARSSCR